MKVYVLLESYGGYNDTQVVSVHVSEYIAKQRMIYLQCKHKSCEYKIYTEELDESP